jgi:antitoxin StbD
MNTVLSTYFASVSELKKNPSQLIEESKGESIAILNHNKPAAYLVPAEKYEMMMEELDDLNISRIIQEREDEKKSAKEVSLDDL